MFRYGFKKRLLELGVDYGSRVLAAVSGGMDSMCMADALLNSGLDLTVAIAHVNFNLRGEESDADTRMVREWCAQKGITLHEESFNTTEFAAEKGISIEMAARELRYNWFYTLMAGHGYDFLAIAHNANDNAETLLLNLTRGCGIEGIGGIREKVELEFEYASDEEIAEDEGMAGDADEAQGEQALHPQYIIRPLMCYSRKQIEKYALKFNVPYRTDSTNLMSDFSRNRIRNEVFPQLERINPSVVATFNRNIRHFRQAAGIMQKHIEEKLQLLCNEFTTFEEFSTSCYAGNMCGLNILMNRVPVENGGIEEEYSAIICIVELARLLEEEEWEFWVYQIASRYSFSPAIIEDICTSISEDMAAYGSTCAAAVAQGGRSGNGEARKGAGGPKRFLSGSGEVIAVKERGLLKFYLNVVPECGLEIETVVIPREAWRTRKESCHHCPTLYMDASKVEMPLSCRSVEPGDRFSPLGLRGSKKVTDYLSDIKFENLHKGNVLVMTDASGKIVCLPGLQIANHVRVTESTQEVLQVTVC